MENSVLVDALKCPCGSQDSYKNCCKPLHRGEPAKSAVQLMRSRYSAYALSLPDYIIATTHPLSPHHLENKFAWRRAVTNFCRHSSFQKLKIINFWQGEQTATVTFTAYLEQKMKEATFTEKSFFEKIHHRWFYLNGQLSNGEDVDLAKKFPLKVLPLAYYGEEILRKKSQPVTALTSQIKKIIEEMVETMDGSEGIGLAAPQIHHSLKLFVMRKPILTQENQLELGEVKVVINPVLSQPSKEQWVAQEGCLSIPNLTALVQRPKEVTIEYENLQGEKIKERVAGWQARIMMHEYDHLEGILFIDRLEVEEKLKLEYTLEKLDKTVQKIRTF